MTAQTIQSRFDSGERVSIWSVPDMSVLNAGRRSPAPMPRGLFGEAFSLLADIAEGTSTPPDYPALAFLSSCASLIGGKRRVRPYASWPSWQEPCILWVGVVGDPSSRKSPALDAVTGPLRLIERDHAEAHASALRTWRENMECADAVKKDWQTKLAKAVKEGLPPPPMPDGADEPSEPVRRRTLVMDATQEALGQILSGNPQGTLHFRDELAGWLSSFNRYSAGGDREFWLEAYGGRPYTIDRKSAAKGTIMVPFNGVSVCGGIQPAKLAEALFQSSDDGLVARFLWAWPDKLDTVTRPRQAADIGALEGLYRRLDGLTWGQDSEGRQTHVTLPLSEKAADIFDHWRVENAAQDESSTALFKSFVGKMDGAVLRLALVAELMAWSWDGDAEPREVSATSLIAAAEWVDDYAKPMAERVYGDAALPKVERNASILARYIVKKGFDRINLRDLKRAPHKTSLPGLRSSEAMNPSVDHLVDAGWLLPDLSRDGDTGGRHRLDYLVNPAVHGN